MVSVSRRSSLVALRALHVSPKPPRRRARRPRGRGGRSPDVSRRTAVFVVHSAPARTRTVAPIGIDSPSKRWRRSTSPHAVVHGALAEASDASRRRSRRNPHVVLASNLPDLPRPVACARQLAALDHAPDRRSNFCANSVIATVVRRHGHDRAGPYCISTLSPLTFGSLAVHRVGGQCGKGTPVFERDASPLCPSALRTGARFHTRAPLACRSSGARPGSRVAITKSGSKRVVGAW